MKTQAIFITILLCTFFISSSNGQEATFQAYPDLHLTNIVGVDIDKNATNALTVSSAGKTIFWDLETQKPLRIWEYERQAFMTQMVLDNNTGVSAFQTTNEDLSTVDFVLYDLTIGNAYDTLSVVVPENQSLKAYAIGPKNLRNQEIALLFDSSVVAIDLYRRRLKWETPVKSDVDDIVYIGNSLMVLTDTEMRVINENNDQFINFRPEGIPDFQVRNIVGKYHISEKNSIVNIQKISEPNKSYKFKNSMNFDLSFISEILPGAGSLLIRQDFGNYAQLIQLDSKSDKILWSKKVLSPNHLRTIYEMAYSSKMALYVYTDYARNIQFIDAYTGIDLNTIENPSPRARITYLSPDFGHMIYSDIPAKNQDGLEDLNPPRSYYLDLEIPNQPFYLFDGEIKKTEYSLDENFIVLTKFGLGEISTQTAAFHSVDYGNYEGHDVPIRDISYDSVSNNLLIHYENGLETAILEENPTSPREIGFIEPKPEDSHDHDLEDILGKNSIVIINKSNKEIKQALSFGNEKKNTHLVPGGQYVYIENTNKSNPTLFDYKNKSYVSPTHLGNITNVVTDKAGTQVLFRYQDKTCVLAELYPKFREIKTFKIDAIPIMMVLNSKLGQIVFKDYQNPNEMMAYVIDNDEILTMGGVHCSNYQDISNDGQFIALTSPKAIQIVNLRDGTHVNGEVKSFEASPSFVRFSNEENLAISCRYSGRLNFWNLETNEMMGTLIMNQAGNYVVSDIQGFFDCSPDAMSEIYYTVRKEVVGLDQLKAAFWDPDLLPSFLDNAGFEMGNDTLNFIPLYPDVKLSTSEFQDTLKIELAANLGGIGQVTFYINNVEIEPDINESREETISLPLNKYEDVLVPDRPNILGIVVYNNEGEFSDEAALKSRQKQIPINYMKRVQANNDLSSKGLSDLIKKAQSQMLDTKKTRIIALIVGTTDYDGTEIDLKYADNDANSMENALRKTGELFLKEDNKVIIHKLISKSNDQNLTSTRANVLSKLEELKKEIKVDDILVLYFSGHGVTKKDEFYYMTKKASSSTMTDTTDNYKNVTIAATEIKDFLKNTKSLRKLLILDACYSGAAAEAFSRKSISNNSSAAQRKAMDLMKDKTGVYILSSSLSEQESLELKKLNQGIMTYSLLDGMSGKASVDSVIQVTNLINHVIHSVPKLAKEEGRIQQPVFISPEVSMPFPIGISDKSIAPTGSKVAIGKASVVDTMFSDVLNLNQVINKQLETVSNQDGSLPFIFNELSTSDNVIIKGMYQHAADKISLEASIIQNNKRIKKLSLSNANAEGLTRSLINELKVLFNKSS